MGLLEKLKNTFFEEEYIEVEEKPIAKKVEPKSKKIVKTEKIEKEEKKVEPVIEVEKEEKLAEVPNYSDKELLKKDTNINYYDEDDFVEVKPIPKKEEPVKEPTKIYGEDPKKLYSHIELDKEEHKPYASVNSKAGFKPTPIISPIYGILDKNYKKEEVIDKKDKPSSYVSRKNADLDFVRNKAFGSLDDDIMMDSFRDIEPTEKHVENKPVEEEQDNENEDNLLVDMTDSTSAPAVDKVTIADAEEYFEDLGLEYNVDYKDSRYEKASGRRSDKKRVADTNNDEGDSANLEDNLFELIDSMYEDNERK